jgi:hypothetical protein
MASSTEKKLVIATRLHLGNASSPPLESKIRGWLENLHEMAKSVNAHGVIAVDATPKIDNYDYVEAIRQQLQASSHPLHILPVTPWGKFVPALNALVLHAKSIEADQIIFVSAEVSASAASIKTLCQHCTDDVLVVGAALNGHLYVPGSCELNGRTCPWNTLAVWNLPKLCLTGFLPCSDWGPSAGVEECVAIAAHQKMFPGSKVKLVKLENVNWQETFDDEERRKWHEQKMNSKLERAGAQMERLQLTGTDEHC